jgi:hypothetical protein
MKGVASLDLHDKENTAEYSIMVKVVAFNKQIK